MRSLHPVGIHEKFVASGIYTHQQGGLPTGTVEYWSVHELPDGAQLIRVDDDWREKDGSSILIEAWRSPHTEGGKIERFDVHAFGGKSDPIKELRATFTFEGQTLDFGRTIDNGPREQMSMELPPEYIVSPKSLIFSGFETGLLGLDPGDTLPIVSFIPTFLDMGSAFKPVMYHQTVVFLKDDHLQLGKKTYETRQFEQHNAVQQRNILWLDAHDVMLQFKSADGEHGALLGDYARRPDPKP